MTTATPTIAPPTPAPSAIHSMLLAQVRPACSMLALLALITGVAYPLGMTVVIRALFPWQAAGSPVRDDTGAVLGSDLIGQPFTGPRWFHGRPSATGTAPYDPTASGGSNLGPTNPALAAAVQERAAALMRENPGHTGAIPIDMVTSSGSGLDPHVSPAAALLQVPRVAAARNLDENSVRLLVLSRVEPSVFGVFGRPRVNVLQLNRAIESMAPAAVSRPRKQP